MRFRKKPVEVEAIQFDGENYDEIAVFVGIAKSPGTNYTRVYFIDTLEGTMTATAGDWIIKGVANEFYPCKDSIFRETYEPVE